MSFKFKIWDQGNDGRTMAVRVKDVGELSKFAAACTQPGGPYPNLKAYLKAAGNAQGIAPEPYTRSVTVVWLNKLGYSSPRVFHGRTLLITYTGNERDGGGFASQGYCIVDPDGFKALRKHHRKSITVDYIPGQSGDTLVVLP